MAAVALMIPAAMAIIILLLNPTTTTCNDAVTSFKPLFDNHTSRAEKYLVGDQDINSEFLMDSHINRILADSQNFETNSTKIANQPSVGECDRPPRYDSCLGEKRENLPPANCSAYNRENPC